MNRDDYYLGIAYAVSRKSTCLRKQYGAVIVKNGEIIATGYNGAPRGEKHCADFGYCSKARIQAERRETTEGEQMPTEKRCESCKSNKDFEEYLDCRSVHAEMNAIISAARKDMIGSALYLAGFEVDSEPSQLYNPRPCKICERLIKNAGIAKVITEEGVIYENKNLEV